LKLLIDNGNTRTKWAVFDGKSLLKSGAILNSKLDDLELPKVETSLAIASSVATNAVLEQLAALVLAQTGCKLQLVEVSRVAGSLQNGYKDLEQLGVDRWVAAIGAYARYPNVDSVVIDAGTAVTIDWVSSQGVFEGGAILPGLQLMHDSLVGNTAGIYSTVLEVNSVIGMSTEECVNSGAFFGLVGAIERVVNEIVQSRPHRANPCNVLVCGGDAQKLLPRLPGSFNFEPDLIFNGLQVLAPGDCTNSS